MQPVPKDILAKFDGLLKQRNVPLFSRAGYRKWMLYFLDFRAKYPLPDAKTDQVKLFADKLRSKNQTAAQVEQAADAISLFFALHRWEKNVSSSATWQIVSPANVPRIKYDRAPEAELKKEFSMVCEPPASSMPYAPRLRSGKQYDEWRCLRKTASSAWDKVIALLADEIKIRSSKFLIQEETLHISCRLFP